MVRALGWGVMMVALAGSCSPGRDAPASGRTWSGLEGCLRHVNSADGTRDRDCLALVTAADGIDAVEAVAIANAYLSRNVAEMGFAGPPMRRGDHWICVARTGTTLTPGDPIRIDATSGAVSSPGHAAFGSLQQFLTSLGERRGPDSFSRR